MRLRTLCLIGGFLAAGATLACATGTVVVSPLEYYPGYTPTVLNYAATQGGMLTEVVGNPFEQDSQEQLERTITRAMATSHFGPELPFITTPPEDFASPYRVVVVFDPAQNISEYKVCRYESEPAAARKNGIVRVHAVLCANEKPLTAISGRVGGIESPGDPRFRRLISQMSLLLFPPYDPNGRDGGDVEFIPL